MAKERTFTWYAEHPKHGELVLLVPSDNAYRDAYIYCPRIIKDRLGRKMSVLQSIELSVGCVGLIPREYYEEAGVMVRTPFSIRMLAVTDHYRKKLRLPKNHVEAHDEELSAFILDEWEKVYNSN